MPTLGPNLAYHKAEAINYVNKVISQVRLNFITDIPGQEALYSRKEKQAQAYKDAGYPTDLTNYPLIAAEVGITAATSTELADLWLQNAADWEAMAAVLETIRMTAIVSINNATSRPNITSALSTFDTSISTI